MCPDVPLVYPSRVLDAMGLILVVLVALLLPATVVVLATGRRGRRRHGTTRPFAAALAAGVCLGLAGATIAWVARAPVGLAATAGLVVTLSVCAWWPVGRQWATRGLVAWSLSIAASVCYLAYAAVWTMTADLSLAGRAGSTVLWLLEAFVVLIGIGHLWEFVDVLTRRRWIGSKNPVRAGGMSARPFVSLHVPTHNEPPEMVIQTLTQLLRQTYDHYEILVIDNNTTDPTLWRPVEAFCAGFDRITFVHVENLQGFKSGALNLALRYTDPRTEVIGIIDADYLVRPEFLAECAPLFGDPRLAFVQTPQDYRSWDVSAYFRRLYYSYGYFFDVSQVSRNELGGAIFGGTMGLIRRAALDAAGGWDEWCITEDAELSLRLLKAGGQGVHIDRSYGHGVMPLTFEALKKQRFRWCFGGVQILRMHWRSLLPGPRNRKNQMTLGQRWAYLVGGLQWFGDVATVLFTGFLMLGAADAVLGTGLVVRSMSGVLLLGVVALVLLGFARALVLAKRSTGAGWRDALGAFGLWLALGWVVAGAAVRGLVAREGVFLRTPKQRGELRASYALRANLTELVLGLVALAVAAVAVAHGTTTSVVVGGLLALQAVGYLLAPANSLAAIRSTLPDELAARRRFTLATWGAARWGGAALVAAACASIVVLAAAGPTPLDQPPAPAAVHALTKPTPWAGGEPTESPSPEEPEPTTPADDERPATEGTDPGTDDGTAPTPEVPSSPPPSATPTPTPTPSETADPGQGTTPTQAAKPSAKPTPQPRATPSQRPSHPAGGAG